MRHAESLYNKIQSDYKEKNGLQPWDPEDESLRFTNTEEIIDAGLTEEGVRQCESSREKLDMLDIKFVITSPLVRALNTGIISFELHHNNPKLIAEGWLRESIKSNCDLAMKTKALQEQHPDIEFRNVDGVLWYLDKWAKPSSPDSIDHADQIKALYSAKPDVQTILDYLEKISPERLEDEDMIYRRVAIAKAEVIKLVQELIEKHGAMDHQILIVAHSNFLKNFEATGVDEDGNLLGTHHFDNAEVREYDLELSSK